MSLLRRRSRGSRPEEAIWQDVEYGAYTADLQLWEELATEGGGSTVEIGAGAGRVTLHLARMGLQVLALEADPDLAAELARRAEGLPARALRFDVTELVPGGTWMPSSPPLATAIAPLHVIQQIEPSARRELLRVLAEMLPEGGRFTATVVDESSLLDASRGDRPAVPDMRDVDGWVYSSEPLWVQVGDDAMIVRRARKRVSPSGEVEESVHDEPLHRLSPDALEAEAVEAGLSPRRRHTIHSGASEADSIAVTMEAA